MAIEEERMSLFLLPPHFLAFSEVQTTSLHDLSASFKVLSIAFCDLSLYTNFVSPSSIVNRLDSAFYNCFHTWIRHFLKFMDLGFLN
jgi:hypothetical protein